MTVGVAVITHTAKAHLKHSLPPLLNSPVRPRVVVVNSSSWDGTVEEAERLGAETLVVPRAEFNHGGTRELARRYLATDIAVMMTPDAYPVDEGMLGRLIEPIVRGDAAVAFARQVARANANVFDSFARRFNYPPEGYVCGRDDVPRMGSRVIFCSNACAAYSSAALDEIGGFRPTLTHEDAIAAAMLISGGHRIAYVAGAIVQHSHNYTLLQEFRRYFDTGYARSEFHEVLGVAGGDERLGRRFVRDLVATVAPQRPWLLPRLIAHVGVKWAGYRIGARSHAAPRWFKRTMSGQDYYWQAPA